MGREDGLAGGEGLGSAPLATHFAGDHGEVDGGGDGRLGGGRGGLEGEGRLVCAPSSRSRDLRLRLYTVRFGGRDGLQVSLGD